jgi:hypothetical protein
MSDFKHMTFFVQEKRGFCETKVVLDPESMVTFAEFSDKELTEAET